MCLFHENKNDWRILNGQTEFLLWLVKLSFRVSFKHPHKEKISFLTICFYQALTY